MAPERTERTTMDCTVCKQPLAAGEDRCSNCGKDETWNRPCPRCQCLIHPEANYCLYCRNDLQPAESGGITEFLQKFSVPIATLSSAIALIVSVIGLKGTIETNFDTSPIVTVLPEDASQEKLNLVIFNSGDRIAYIESATLSASVAAASDDDETARIRIEPQPLKIDDKAQAIIDVGKNEVAFSGMQDEWRHARIAETPVERRAALLSRDLRCDLAMLIRDPKSGQPIASDPVRLLDRECFEFVLYKYQN